MVDFCILEGGHCTGLERVTFYNGRYQHVDIPNMFGLIRHPTHGVMLFDTGYCTSFYEKTNRFPYSVYASLIPVFVKPHETAKSQLIDLGIQPEDVNYIFISHFHADHISGLCSFPNAKFIYMDSAYKAINKFGTIRSTVHAFIPEMLPSDFLERSLPLPRPAEDPESRYADLPCTKIPLPEEVKPFDEGYDIFGDGSIFVVEMTGHCTGHIGLLVRPTSYIGELPPAQSTSESTTSSATETKQDDVDNNDDGSSSSRLPKYFFLVGDSCWSSHTITDLHFPLWVTYVLVHCDGKKYTENIHKLHRCYLNNKEKDVSERVEIVPSHCSIMKGRWVGGARKNLAKL
ncbi:hypothetical protein HK102_009875 [Quaeritorhiza haematococci]|nr:hypothetical protein HK102_009875 [Quaeritorhiza haematococci]